MSLCPLVFSLQVKEMGGSRRPAESLRTSEQPTEKKRGFGDWMNFVKPAAEEKDHWVTFDANLSFLSFYLCRPYQLWLL